MVRNKHWHRRPEACRDKARLIIDTALDAVVAMDAQGTITSWNKQAEAVFGWSNREAIGQRMSDMIIPAQQRIAHERGLRHFLDTGEGPILRRRIEVTAVRRSGAEFPVELEVMPVRLGHEWVFSAFIRDITDSRLAHDKLRESELNLRQMTETIPEMLWSATPEGAVDYCNGRLLDYTGFSAEEVIGNVWTTLLHPDDVDRAGRVWRSCVTTGAPYRVEVRTFHAADHTYRWCVTNARPLQDDEGRILKWHGTVVDMHDWKQAQEELRNTQEKLAHVTRVMTIGELTASIAHEVNQPLSGIITNAGTCLRMLGTDPPDVDGARETARRTIRDGNRASDVITRLRALFSKKEFTRRETSWPPLGRAE
jgi:PAS domain S-box-containing protein